MQDLNAWKKYRMSGRIVGDKCLSQMIEDLEGGWINFFFFLILSKHSSTKPFQWKTLNHKLR